MLRIPDSWDMLPPGDAGLTRKLKSLGPSWTVKITRRRREMSVGVWAPRANIEEARAMVRSTREDPAYAKRMASAAERRDRAQSAYVEDFESEILRFLSFAPLHDRLALAVARAVARHATPVGSGTVARTQRIPIERRAEAAVIAWMRHQTTAYDSMKIARVKGQRREVRRMLAERSRQLLEDYRRGVRIPLESCTLSRAVARANEAGEDPA